MQNQILKEFKFKAIINQNPTEKVIYLLGQISNKEGEAILILTPKLLQSSAILEFSSIKQIFHNDIYRRLQAKLMNSFQIQLIFPITQKHKKKYIRKQTKIIKQTQEMYEKAKQKLLSEELKHLGWVQNILDGKAQAQRILFKCQDFVILPDFKYSDFKNHDNLHLLLIFANNQLHSIRDLNQTHLKLLQKASQEINKVLTQKIKIKSSCRVYFHYPPTFYQLHLHIMTLKLSSASSCVERGHELLTVIDNLSIKSKYYKQARLNKFIQAQVQ